MALDPLSLREAAAEHGERPFLLGEGWSFTFAEAAAEVEARASALLALGASAERGVSFVATASPDVVLTLLAGLEAGVPLIPLHPRWSDAERARALSLVPDALAVEPAELGRAAATAPRRAISAHDPEQLAAVLFTSGTSAAPKGVRLARRCFIASARAHAENLPFAPDDRWLLAMPLSHVGGLSILTRALVSRTAVVLAAADAQSSLAAIARHRVTLASAVPASLARLLDADEAGHLRQLRALLVGGAPFDPALRRRAAEAGVAALATYGLTETCSQIATQSLARPRDPSASDSGRALSGARVVAEGRRLRVSGDMVMLGYVGGPAVPRGAFIDAGDVGELGPDGDVVVWGRADDTIVSGGENVHPSEVERALLELPGVREACVFGLPDPVWGQLVAVALVLSEGAAARDVLAKLTLASFKRPRRFAVVEELAPEGSAKVSRRQLASALAPRLEAMSYEGVAR